MPTPFEFQKKLHFAEYAKSFGDVLKNIDLLQLENLPPDAMEYLLKASAVYSSNIEGNSIDLNSFMNYGLQHEQKQNREIQEIQDLKLAYEFAKMRSLCEENILQAHATLSQTFLPKEKAGVFRNESIGVFGTQGLVYLAVEPKFVHAEMDTFLSMLMTLLKEELSTPEVFYYASLLHLIFAHIHPFADGNGRMARLIEKWFLSEKLGKGVWGIASEKFYKEHQGAYYKNLNLGVNYYELDYSKAMPFLGMLVGSVRNV